jgi:tripartite-type tricarboxylate transporter receptor subunit TctC
MTYSVSTIARLCRTFTLAAICALPLPAMAQTNYFASKTITLYVGFTPGGGADGEARVIANHLGRFIPGNPNFVLKNMPGAGGITLANHIYNNTEPDGLTIAMPGRSGFLLSNVVKENNVRYELAKFKFIGGAGGTNSILWLRKNTGILTVADIKKTKRDIVLGAWSARAQNAIVPKVLRHYEGWPFKVVHGYPGTNEVILAVDRGEVDGLYSHQGSLQNIRPDMITEGRVVPVFQTYQEQPNVPTLDSLISNPHEKALLALLNAPSRIGLPLLAPPALAADKLDILRSAFAQMAKDKAYMDEAEKRGIPVGDPVSGQEMQGLVSTTLSNVNDDLLQEYLGFLNDKSLEGAAKR